jgi:adenosylcobinamide-phosphate synthase
MSLELNLAMLALALPMEALMGYPQGLYRVIGHPVTWMGRLVAWLDRSLNRERWTPRTRGAAGVAALAILLAATGGASAALAALAGSVFGAVAPIVLAIMATSLIAQRSLAEHVGRVATALGQHGIEHGRIAVAHIVGRDPAALDEPAICRAAIESLAENFSDGVVAPAFWLGAGGLPGGALYKAINTADSMIGHRTPRHQAFGWAAARLDDLVNLPASRLSALLIIGAAALARDASPGGAWRCVRRDAGLHGSPNAGWPEAAMAGALGLRLAGPRVYGGVRVDDPWMGSGREAATVADIRLALALYRRACLLLWGLVVTAAITADALLSR